MNAENPIITQDSLTSAPLSAATLHELHNHNFEPINIDTIVAVHQGIIRDKLDEMEVMLAMSRPSGGDEVPLPPPTTPRLTDFSENYLAINQDPVRKQEFDSEQVKEFLSSLGVTNNLRDELGFDGGFVLGRLANLLKKDYDNLPAEEQKPERRMTEAVLAEELALLWKPSVLAGAKQIKEEHRGYLFDIEDPNLFDAHQLAKLSEEERWDMIGTRLCDEAAELFDQIAASESAQPLVSLEARNRAIDMRMRSIDILYGLETDGKKLEALDRQARELTDGGVRLAEQAWMDKDLRKQTYRANGRLYEFIALARTRRDKLISDPNHLVRMALPREDRAYGSIPKMLNADNLYARVSYDIVEEDIDGNPTQYYQVKSVSEEFYQVQKAQGTGPWEHGPQFYPQTKMIFLNEDWLPSTEFIKRRPLPLAS